MLKDINHPSFLQDWKHIIDAAYYEWKIDDNMSKPYDENKLIVMIGTCTDQPQ